MGAAPGWHLHGLLGLTLGWVPCAKPVPLLPLTSLQAAFPNTDARGQHRLGAVSSQRGAAACCRLAAAVLGWAAT